jgi:hypothetical protein
MGFKSAIKKVGSVLTGGGGGGGGGGAAAPRPEYAELKNLRTQQENQATTFRNNMKGMEEDQNRSDRMRGREELTRGLSDIKSGYNSRGLLYSGLRRADEITAGGEIGSALAGKQAETRAGLEGSARGFEDNAINTGLLLNSLENQSANARFEEALAAREARMKAMGSVGGAAGGLIGNYLGRNG